MADCTRQQLSARIRAKIDPAAITTPPNPRPSLRATSSTASIQSGISLSSGVSRTRPIMTPSQSLPIVTRSDTAPITRIGARASSPSRTSMSRSCTSTSTNSEQEAGPSNYARTGMNGSMRPPSRAATAERIRVKASLTSQPNTPTPASSTTRPPFLKSNSSVLSTTRAASPIIARARKTASPERIRVSTTTTTTADVIKATNNPSLARIQRTHPNLSAPPSPHHPYTPILSNPDGSRSNPRNLHYSPLLSHPPPLPIPPDSPNLRIVDLPTLTPRRSLDGSTLSGGSSFGEYGRGGPAGIEVDVDADRGWINRDRLSGSTAVDSELGLGFGLGGEGQKLGVKLSGSDEGNTDSVKMKEVDSHEMRGLGEELEGLEDIEEAKINRKIADLEISNASLMAINRSLESTKTKQRSEIFKLRRLLRESQNPFPLSLSSPNPLSSPTASTPFPMDMPDGYFDEDFEDPELEGRWERVQDLVEVMKTRGEKGLERRLGVGGVRVLGEVTSRDEGEGEEGVGDGDLSFGGGEGNSLGDEMGDVSAEI